MSAAVIEANIDKIIQYLNSRMVLKREMLESDEIDTISFDEFLEESKKLDMTKEEKETLSKDLAERILFTDEEIASLLILIKKSFDMGLSKKILINETEKDMIRKALRILDDEPKLEIWKKYFDLKKTPGLTGEYTGHITFSKNECIIRNHDEKLLYRADENGIVCANVQLAEETTLLAKNLYVGILHKKGEQILTVFLAKGDKMEAIDCDFVEYSTNKEDRDYAEITCGLNEYLKQKGFEFLTSSLYNKSTFGRIISIFTEISKAEQPKNFYNSSKRGY